MAHWVLTGVYLNTDYDGHSNTGEPSSRGGLPLTDASPCGHAITESKMLHDNIASSVCDLDVTIRENGAMCAT